MAIHTCKECGKNWTLNKQGRPPAKCPDCRGQESNKETKAPPPKTIVEVKVVEKVDAPAQEYPPTNEAAVSIANKSVKTPAALEDGTYQVIVTNMGSAYQGTDEKEAVKTYNAFVEKSSYGFGQVGFEMVTLFKYEDGSKIKVQEFDPRKELK